MSKHRAQKNNKVGEGGRLRCQRDGAQGGGGEVTLINDGQVVSVDTEVLPLYAHLLRNIAQGACVSLNSTRLLAYCSTYIYIERERERESP
jgi:hypothetical protein